MLYNYGYEFITLHAVVHIIYFVKEKNMKIWNSTIKNVCVVHEKGPCFVASLSLQS